MMNVVPVDTWKVAPVETAQSCKESIPDILSDSNQ